MEYSSHRQTPQELDLLSKVDEVFLTHYAAVIEAVQPQDLSTPKAPLLFLSGICESPLEELELSLVRRVRDFDREQTFVFIRNLAETAIQPLFSINRNGCYPIDIVDEMPGLIGPITLKNTIDTVGWDKDNSWMFAHKYFPLPDNLGSSEPDV